MKRRNFLWLCIVVLLYCGMVISCQQKQVSVKHVGCVLDYRAHRNFLFMIPQADLNSNPALTQNPDNQ